MKFPSRKKANGTGGNYASSIKYTPHGAASSMILDGNGLTEATTYNSRLQPVSLQAGSLLTLGYYYCPSGANTCTTNNNGNVQRQTITAGSGFTRTIDYTYTDPMNRLSSAIESGGANEWKETYGYDNYGNRWVSDWNAALPPSGETPLSLSGFDALHKNQLTAMSYDAAGNQTSLLSFGISYDAENRQTKTTINSVSAQYAYDGDGRRVKKVSGGATTVYVYDAQGELAAEYGANTDTGTSYLTADHLGSTRLVSDGHTVCKKRYDYRPFGEDIPVGIGDRSTALCYGGADPATIQFTGKERDTETVSSATEGLDYFGARYFSGAQGRMTSPDPFMIMTQAENREQLDAYLGNPQNWNRYAYALNNPLRYIDPTGLDPISVEDCQKNSECTVVKVNIVLDANAAIFDNDGNLQQQYQEKLDSQIAEAADEYGNANIALDVHTTTAAVDNTYVGEKSAITVVVTDSRDSYSSYSWLGASGASYTRLNIGTSQTNTIAHEFSHHLTGDTRSLGIPYLSNAISDYNNDVGRAVLRNWNTTVGKILRTADPFLYLHRRDIMQNARHWYGGR